MAGHGKEFGGTINRHYNKHKRRIKMNDITEEQISEKIEDEVKKRLVNLFTSTDNFSGVRFMIEDSAKSMQRNIEYEIRSTLGTQLNEARKQLDCLISPKIIDRVNEFESQICSLLKDHQESITKFQQETLNKFKNEATPISNLYIINEKINVSKRLNAEEYVKSKLEQQGFKVIKQTCDNGAPDFAVYKKIGEDKNILEMDSYEILMREVISNNPRKELIQKSFDIKLPIHSKHPLFIEVKTNGDGLRMNQLEWIKNHPDDKVIVYCIEQTVA
jgi:hypothetical protein